MTGPEHYQAAEQALDSAMEYEVENQWRGLYLAQAQVHATLASVAMQRDVAAGEGLGLWLAVLD